MPEWIYAVVTIGIVAGLGFFLWKHKQMEDRRKREDAQMKHEQKMGRHRPTIKARLKAEKAQLKYEQK